MQPDLSPSAQAKQLSQEFEALGARVERIVKTLQVPKKQQQAAEQVKKAEELKAAMRKAEARAHATGGADEHISEFRRLKRELASLQPAQDDTRDDDDEKKTPRPLMCPIDGLVFVNGACPANRNHREGMDPYAGLKASRERLAPHLGRRIWE
jgi:hypothetical protein